MINSNRNANRVIRNAGKEFILRVTRYALLYSILVFSGFPALAAGQAGLDIAVLNAGVGARPLGMGSAFTAIADNADAPYWNPAGLGLLNKSEITTMQTRLSSDTDHYYVSYIQPVLGGTLGISWVQVGLGNINQTSAEVDFHNEVQNISIFSYFSNAYLIAYGKELSDKVSLGLTAKYLSSDMTNISGGQGSGYSITPGLLVRVTPYALPVTIGLKIDELFNQQQWGTGTVERVPPKLRLGLAYKSPNPGLFALDIAQIVKTGYSPELSGGYEYSLGGLSLRLGYVNSGLTAGAGFQVNHTRVDYAYVSQKDLSRDNVHRISLSGIW
ncbi:MAG: PorV/PorQ family protein [Candidatus Margulisiibacteriota bacterium]